MYNADANPLRAPLTLFLVALSVSIGWGIRGNFGHEAGAMIPGALGAIAIAACSRRQDWQARIPHAALLGGLGWGFGGSISYMYPVAFTMSAHFPTMAYGMLAVFLEGGLWCAMGTAGAALALTAESDRLTGLYKPMLFAMGGLVIHAIIEGPLEHFLATPDRSGMDTSWHRQKSPLYWFDADWFSALCAALGVCAYDLWDRRFARGRWLPVSMVAGGLAGGLVQYILGAAGLLKPLVDFVVVRQGDMNYINPATAQPFDPAELLTNWPQFFGDYPQHVGWLIGALLGLALYFARFGKWRNGAGLFLAMSLGWLIAFLAMPVFGSIFLADYGGFRMTPPRSDDWAGIVGVFIGMLWWTRRNGFERVTLAGSLGFLWGGIAFATGLVIRVLLIWPGHIQRHGGTAPYFFKHYQSANWHSFMEQTQGFCLGLALVLALGVVWRSDPPCPEGAPTPPWTRVLSAILVMFFLTWLNVFKNVEEWTSGVSPALPDPMKAPLFGFIELSAAAWFNLGWLAAAAAFLFIFIRHTRAPVPLMPASGPGKGQLLYLFVLWLMVIANFTRALPHFTEGRLITEWVVFMNACLATALLATRATAPYHYLAMPLDPLPQLRSLWARWLPAAVVLMFAYAVLFKALYGDTTIQDEQHAHKRFGPEAIWRTQPILKHGEHR
jgi:hypothetical protein